MTDQKPDAGDNDLSTDHEPTPPETEEVETVAEQSDAAEEDASTDADAPEPADELEPADGAEAEEAPAEPQDAGPAEGEASEADGIAAAADEAAADEAAAVDVVAETEAEAADAAAAGAAWTTTPVAPDPEATEAALAALAAKPEVTLEPPETPPPLPPGGEEDEGTPVLLVGGILVGAFIVALAIVLILFRPFDSVVDSDASLSPSPIVTEEPSESPATAFVDTPNFQGLPLEEAEAKATDYGLVVRVNPVETDEVDPGTVLGQEPGPGESVEEGTIIELAVAQPVPTASVPDVVGLNQEDATELLEEFGFTVGDVSFEFDDDIPAGRVISTDPAVDSELPQGSEIDLVISDGPETVAVPDIVDQAEAEALDTLDAAGLAAGERTEAFDPTIVAGNVISSDPAADSEVGPGTAVDYVVSLGVETVAVPDIVDQAEAEALDTLDAAGLAAGERTEAFDPTIVAGNVISSDPAADSEVGPGTAVDYVVSLGVETVAVPDIVDQAEAEALDTLDAAGLAAGERTEAFDPTIVAGNVISSDPAADSEVGPGTAVDYVVSLGVETVAVPDIVDQAEAEALDTLDAAGLAAGERTEAFDPTIVAGNVISSDPAADSEVGPGTAVDYVVSLGVETVAVPDLSGPASEADQRITDAGFIVGVTFEVNSDTIPAGDVNDQDPAAGELAPPGSEIDYTISIGPEQVEVPDLTGAAADAPDTITAAGLTVGDATQAFSDTVPAGDVISQSPQAGATVDIGTAVDYVVSLGVETVAVPDLSGPASEADQRITDAGFIVGVTFEVNSDTIPAGDVNDQDPAAGELAPPGSEIDYTISIGLEQVEVPDLTGAAADAPDTITAAGLTVGDATQAFSDTVPAGDVISQSPQAGATVDIGTAVDYVVSLGVEQVEVPVVRESSQEDATTAIEAAGLSVGEMIERNHASVPAGAALRTEPAAGEMVDIGSAVSLFMSIGPEQVEVPDLTGAAADAPDTITAAGLTVGDATQAFSDTVAAGDVISQSPQAGATVDIGTAVDYVESLGVEQVEVPVLTGRSEADALDTITAAGLTVGDATQAFSDTVPAGDVISQSPQAGATVDIGTAVDYVVSLGVETVAVPDLSGPASEADQRITDAGFIVGVTFEVNSDTIPAGDVNDQDPAAGELAPLGSEIDYTISIGPEQVAVPDLTGQSEADALDAIDGAGLAPGNRSEDFSDSVPAGDVISQTPGAGAMADIGSAVDYVVSLGVETVAVPDIVDQAEAEALDTLDAAGLAAGERTEAFDPTIVAGNVISSDPAADSEVAPGSAVAYVVSLGVETVAVPDLTGAAADADQKITDAGFVVGVTFEVNSDTIPAGDVNDQDPAAGELAPLGSEIDYTISIGPEQVAVPDLTGQSEADALDAIDGAGLAPGNRSEDFSDSVPAGDVISQTPGAGAMADIGSAVDYVVSLGVETVAVPDIVDQAEAEALDTLDAAGLAAGERTEAFDPTIVAGNVISSDPAADSEVAPGSAVAYVVSLGVETVAVPDLTGAAADADQKITDAGFVVGVTFEVNSDTIPAGDVNDQDPAAGELAPLGSEIDYTISIGPEQVAVPDLTGQSEADALDAIDGAGLAPGNRSEDFSDSVPAGDVISQTPGAGAMADIGSAVDYVVSLGVETVAVPDLTGAAADADQRITDAGLTVGDTTEAFSDTVAAGDVISQDPTAGTEVELGTAVAYVESLGVEQVEVPVVRELSQEDATSAIEAAGLTVGEIVERNHASVPAGAALRTEPAAGEMVDIGSAVSLFMSIGPEQVAVPDLTGAAADADQKITDAGLTVGDTTEAFSDSVPAGDVISQTPGAGAMADIGSAVDYVVSLGVETVAVPDLTGAAADADQRITDAGLTVGDTTEAFSDTVAAGDVISQDPTAGTEVELGTAVAYVESLGVEQVEVPVVRELSQEDATSAIEAAGLTVGEIVERNHASVPAGAALRTEPAAGEMVDIGSAVSLFMSIGPEQVEVPDVVGLPEADAITAIEAAKLRVGDATQAFSDTVAAGDVISTNPGAGTTVDADSAVDYVLSLGIEQVAVPDVIDMAQAEAGDAIDAARLSVGETSTAFDEIIIAGNVVSQDPVPGSQVDKGSAIDLVVSDGPTPFVTVPATRDLPEAEAIAAIEDANLVVGETIFRTHEGVAEGAAIKTEPKEGTEILHGEPVELYVSTGSQFRTIPDVSGLEAAEAQALLEAEDLTVVSDERSNAKFPAGQAVKTEPAAGTEVEIGAEVTLVVSRGPKQVDIPDVVGMSRAAARTAITDAELKVGDETVVEDDAAKNTVIVQEPVPGGQADKNSRVNLTVSSGPPQLVVPAVRDLPAAEAQAELEDLGLVVESKEVFHAKVAAGDAIKTAPEEGTPVDVGSTVTLNVSKGPKPVEVPEVTGLKQGAAMTAIEDAGLTVGEQTTVEDAADQNTVIAQVPDAGSEAPAGSAVALTISSGPPTVVIPDVRDLPAAEAQAELEDLGLVVESKEVFHAKVAAGDAIKTKPAADASVPVGSIVQLNVSKGPKPVIVPDVVGSKKVAAATAIEDAGLTVGEQTTVEDAADENTVVDQDPAADAEVAPGSTVDLTISSGPPVAAIPDVRDLPAADAQAELEDLGLVVETKGVFHANVSAGDAIKTKPAAGESVPVGSTVTLNVSKGPKPVIVPEITGLSRSAATTAIEDAGLTVGEQTTVEDPGDRNTVLTQDPPAGTEVATGSAVNLTISSGPPSETIPDVRDVAAGEARAQLESLGLVVETKEVFHAKVAAGDAIKTKPAAGESVPVGSTVTLNVSKGPKPVEVPDVVGSRQDAASTAIADAGLTVGEQITVEDPAEPNTVVGQDPPAGTEVATGSAVNLTISSGPPAVTIPEVRDVAQARAVNDLENLGLVVETKEVFHAKVAAGDAIKTKPAAGESVPVGSTVTLNVSKGIKQVTVPNLVGLAEGDVEATLQGAELTTGSRAEAENEAPAGTVVDQSPAEGATVDKDSSVDYTVSTGPAIVPMGAGGDLDDPEVSSQLDLIASEIEPVRELGLNSTPYDGSNSRQHELALAERIRILRNPDAIKAEERALKRLGLLEGGDDLAQLLETLYGQALPVAYFEDDGHLSVLEGIDELDAGQRAQAAREFDRALTDQSFGLGATRVGDKTRGDEALAGYALEQGDGTAAMLEWSADHGNSGQTNDVIVPGDDGIYGSMPLLLQREYSLPFLEGRIFVDRLRDSGGWGAVNDAWSRPPESTEQILHPKLYPNERPTTIDMNGIAGQLGGGWKEDWQQTMGELRIGVWLADGASGEQSGPKAAVKLPRANAAAGWGGDRLLSLSGPDGQWAVVWQTKWDTSQDVEQFTNAAGKVIAGLDGAAIVAATDVSSGVSNPAVVLVANDAGTLASVAEALGVPVPEPA